MKYIWIRPTHSSGFFGYMWQVIRAIYKYPYDKYYIDFSYIPYQERGTNKNAINVFDLFFEQPHFSNKPPATDAQVITGVMLDSESEFIENEIFPNTPQEMLRRRRIFNTIIEKYIILKTEIKSEIEDYYNLHMRDYKVLGVHLRGTDHPEKIDMNDYISLIRKEVGNYDKIFVMSDELSRIKRMMEEFSPNIIFWNGLRSNNENPLHLAIGCREYYIQIAKDVIIESYLLSKTDYIFCCSGSNVNYFSRSLSPNLRYIEIRKNEIYSN